MFTEYQWEQPIIKDLELINEVLRINNISVSDAIDALGTTCIDFLKHCFWNGVEFPCFQADENMNWQSSYSFLGACCSFNYHSDEETIGTHRSFHADTIGIDGGLTIILTGAPQISDGKSGALYSAGFVVCF